MKPYRKLSIVAMIAGVTGFALMFQNDKVWASSCFSHSCTGEDPILMGCETDKKILSQESIFPSDVDAPHIAFGKITLYYSPSCHAKWAASFGAPSADNSVSVFLEDLSRKKIALGFGTAERSNAFTVRSTMVSADISSEACTKVTRRLRFIEIGSACTSYH